MSKTLTKPEILAKFGKLYASDSARKPILGGIHYATDGTAVVTNSYHMLRIHGGHSFQQPITLHAKTGQPIEGTYPDASRIFPSSFNDEITVPQSAMPDALFAAQCAATLASKINKKNPIVRLELQNRSAFLKICNEQKVLNLSVRLAEEAPNRNSVRTLNAEYLVTALAVFNAAGTGVEIKMRDPVEPIVFTNDNGIDVMIVPYRVPQ
ncbi:hypothetical protein [Paenibacillus oleatilyticus]|uniref:Uncharacterized protein n=1 Tax=Paenibacillus oleatilyticus TaxID=2594886 RepID=A0ABV4V8Q6_9BACL